MVRKPRQRRVIACLFVDMAHLVPHFQGNWVFFTNTRHTKILALSGVANLGRTLVSHELVGLARSPALVYGNVKHQSCPKTQPVLSAYIHINKHDFVFVFFFLYSKTALSLCCLYPAGAWVCSLGTQPAV